MPSEKDIPSTQAVQTFLLLLALALRQHRKGKDCRDVAGLDVTTDMLARLNILERLSHPHDRLPRDDLYQIRQMIEAVVIHLMDNP